MKNTLRAGAGLLAASALALLLPAVPASAAPPTAPAVTASVSTATAASGTTAPGSAPPARIDSAAMSPAVPPLPTGADASACVSPGGIPAPRAAGPCTFTADGGGWWFRYTGNGAVAGRTRTVPRAPVWDPSALEIATTAWSFSTRLRYAGHPGGIVHPGGPDDGSPLPVLPDAPAGWGAPRCATADCGGSVIVAPLSQEPPSEGPCTSPEKVVCMIRRETPQEREESREHRMRYHALLGEMDRVECAMRAEGRSEEEIARRLVRLRNEAKDVVRAGMTPEEVRELEARNQEKYGNPLGPTADQLYAKYGSWAEVTAAATRTSKAVDSELGLEYRPCPCADPGAPATSTRAVAPVRGTRPGGAAAPATGAGRADVLAHVGGHARLYGRGTPAGHIPGHPGAREAVPCAAAPAARTTVHP
ncbi:hypothetical protein SYYSPA8_14095 [Streptomyces yaizuensis]|uniref:Uncharacterized protein n=1 Tax=Streptomyces yaizuensis TaxID=2989713 RepID=A0ABQ5NZ50_9ACTN|nr:hypothetical protein SYYSPA8_14095 [Streptomyces sp. YSPA8]